MSDDLTLDGLVFPDSTDPVVRVFAKERIRIAEKFDPLVVELEQYGLDSRDIVTLKDAADLLLTAHAQYHRAAAILGEAMMERRRAQLRRDVSKARAEQKVADLIRNDPEVRSVSPQAAQQARAQNRAVHEFKVAAGCQQLYLLSSGYLERIQAVADSLRDAKKDLSEYTRTMRDSAFVGDPGLPAGPTLSELPL